MDINTLTLNFLTLISLISFIATLLISKYSHLILAGRLQDKDFLKPQAFHSESTPRSGGLAIFLVFVVFIFAYYFLKNIFLTDYIIICLFLFLLGFLDDLKIKINPNIRLASMLVILTFSINFFSIEITKSGLDFFNFWLENYFFQTSFVLLCFLFVINGANLIDGFNGLLGIHFLIISLLLIFINSTSLNLDLSIIIMAQVILVFSFLLFNFPKAKIFLGDSGSYLLGTLIALNVIKTYQLNPEISPFFFAGILFYLFYEVFFSFIRKVMIKVSPLEPDKKHFHMLVYKSLFKCLDKKHVNYVTSILINTTYLLAVLPIVYFRDNGLLCRYWFFFQILIYTSLYLYLYRKTRTMK